MSMHPGKPTDDEQDAAAEEFYGEYKHLKPHYDRLKAEEEARIVRAARLAECGEDHIVGSCPESCFACLDDLCNEIKAQRDALLEVAHIEQVLQMRGYTRATAKSLGEDAEQVYLSAGSTGLNNWRREKREAAIAKAIAKAQS